MNPFDSDYTASGFDAFLSRSIDNLPQANLDSQGPSNSQIRYDFSQLSGAAGDGFRLGRMFFDGKTNTITLNDGVVRVNDSRTGARIDIGEGRIVYTDNASTPRLLIDAKYGMKFSKAGKDVLVSGTTPGLENDLIFNSDQNTFKIIKSATATTTNATATAAAGSFASGSTEVTIAHGLSFTPVVIAFLQDVNYTPNRYRPLPWTTYENVSGTACNWYTFSADADSTNVTLFTNCVATGGSASSGTRTIKYYLLQETVTGS